jgi:hypothetical protein
MSVRGKQSLDRQVETILHQKASAITDKKVFPLVCSSNSPPKRHFDSLVDIQAIGSSFASEKGAVYRRHGGFAISEG